MKSKFKDIKRINKNYCETKDCSNKATTLSQTIFLCKTCFDKVKTNQKLSKGGYYLNYIKNRLVHS